MNNENKILIFLVDDDPLFMKLLEIAFLERGDFNVETYSTGEICLANLSHNPDLIVLDYNLDGINKNAMNGLVTLDKVKDKDPEIPVIMLSSQDSIDVAISCMHHNASDYIVKSETAFFRLQKTITSIFSTKKLEKTLNWYMQNA
jgi:two-component system, OmpR family, response regulator